MTDQREMITDFHFANPNELGLEHGVVEVIVNAQRNKTLSVRFPPASPVLSITVDQFSGHLTVGIAQGGVVEVSYD